MNEYEIMGKTVAIAIIFYTFGWLFRASRMEKKVLESNSQAKEKLEEIYSSFKKEIEFAQIERDNHIKQQEQQVELIKKISKKVAEITEAKQKEKKENATDTAFEYIKNV